MTVALKGYVHNSAGTAKAGLTVEVYTTADVLTDTTTTDGDGMWTFAALAVGAYKVKIIDGSKVLWLDSRSQIELTTLDLITSLAVDTINERTAAAGVSVDGVTLKDNHLVPKVNTVASAAEPAINVGTTNIFTITALAVAITSFTTNLTGTPFTGQKLEIRILDNGTARAITWGASFASRGGTLPTTTTISKYLRVGLEWNEVTSTWDCIAVVEEA